MSSQSSPCGAAFLHQQHRNRRHGLPAALFGDPRSNPTLHVKPAEHLLSVRQPRLDLNDEQNPRHGVKGKHVDPPSIAVDVEAHLGLCHPAGISEDPDQPVLEPRVLYIGLRALTVDPHLDCQVGTHRRSPSLDVHDGAVREVASFPSAHLALGYSQACAKLSLVPALSAPNRSQDPHNGAALHLRIVLHSTIPGHYRRITRWVGQWWSRETRHSQIPWRWDLLSDSDAMCPPAGNLGASGVPGTHELGIWGCESSPSRHPPGGRER